MSLYLCIFDDDEEVDGVDVGAYSDFAEFRDTIARVLEDGKRGSRFPVLMLHPDSEGEWSVEECSRLVKELERISVELKQHPAREFAAEWQKNVAKQFGIHPTTLYDCFIDVDGESLIDRLISLAAVAQQKGLPVLFQ